jgi:hypothetical protein
MGRVLQFSPHFPGDPEEENAAGEKQPDDLQERRRHQRKDDSQHSRCCDAEENCATALLFWKSCGGEADDDGVVASKREVDPNYLKKSRPERRREVDERPVHSEALVAQLADRRAKAGLMPRRGAYVQRDHSAL